MGSVQIKDGMTDWIKDGVKDGVWDGVKNGVKNILSSKIDNSIKVLTENWKYKQTLFSKFHLGTYFSFSQSNNTLKDYEFNFLERDAFSENPGGKDIEKLQAFANNDLEGTLWNGYSFSRDFSEEKENTFGYDIQYEFKISSLISGYFSYDTIRYIEKIPNNCKNDLGIPDVRLLRPRTLIIYDNLKKKFFYIINVFHVISFKVFNNKVNFIWLNFLD